MKELLIKIGKAIQEFLEKREVFIPVPVPCPEDFKEWNTLILLSGVLFGEARGEPRLAKAGVAWVVKNRRYKGGWFGSTSLEVMTKKWQFSSLLPDDPNFKKIRNPLWYEHPRVWIECYNVAAGVLKGDISDPTDGATHFFDDSIDPPNWIKELSFRVKIGSILFYGPQ